MTYKKMKDGEYVCKYLMRGEYQTFVLSEPTTEKLLLRMCSCLDTILELQIDELHKLVEKVRQVYADASQGSFLYTEKRFPSAYWLFLAEHTAFYNTKEPLLKIEAVQRIPQEIVPQNIYIDKDIRDYCNDLYIELKEGADQLKMTIKKYQHAITRSKI